MLQKHSRLVLICNHFLYYYYTRVYCLFQFFSAEMALLQCTTTSLFFNKKLANSEGKNLRIISISYQCDCRSFLKKNLLNIFSSWALNTINCSGCKAHKTWYGRQLQVQTFVRLISAFLFFKWGNSPYCVYKHFASAFFSHQHSSIKTQKSTKEKSRRLLKAKKKV